MDNDPGFTLFLGTRLVARGSRADVTAAARCLAGDAPLLAFADDTGRVADLDLRPDPAPGDPPPRGRGRPRLGVAAREVTLLPDHWHWLSRQPGGASATLRRLVDAARSAPPSPEARARAAREAAYHFLQAIAGDLPGYEEALRALFRADGAGLRAALAPMPPDIGAHALRLAEAGLDG